jgi:hypothetical protein
MEHERPQLSPEDRFKQGIEARFETWRSVIAASGVDEKLRDAIMERVSAFREDGLTKWRSLDDAIYGTINQLLTLTNAWRDKGSAAAVLFETLRDDLWDFHKEVTN